MHCTRCETDYNWLTQTNSLLFKPQHFIFQTILHNSGRRGKRKALEIKVFTIYDNNGRREIGEKEREEDNGRERERYLT
jgi:hypothetical protein